MSVSKLGTEWRPEFSPDVDLEADESSPRTHETKSGWSLLSKTIAVVATGAGAYLASYLARFFLDPVEEMELSAALSTAVVTTTVAARHLLSDTAAPLVFPNLNATEEVPFSRSWLNTDFFKSNGDSLTISASQTNGQPLPDGLSVKNEPMSILSAFILPISPSLPQGASLPMGYSKNCLYLPVGDRMAIIDLGNNSTPKIISMLEINAFSNIEINNNLLYVVNTDIRYYAKVLTMINVADPSNPRTVGSIPLPSFDRNYIAGRYIKIADGFCYAFSQKLNQPLSFTIVNVTDAVAPHIVGLLVMPAITNPNFVVGGDYCYVADTHGILSVIDVADKAKPHLLSSLNVSSIQDMTIHKDRLFAATSGLKVIDVSHPSKLKIIGSFPIPGESFDIVVAGDFCYVEALEPKKSFAGFAIYKLDVSDPSNPVLASHVSVLPALNCFLTEMAISDRYCYFGQSTYSGGDPKGGLVLYAASLGDAFSLLGTPAPRTEGKYGIAIRAQGNTTNVTKIFEWTVKPAITLDTPIPNQTTRVGLRYVCNMDVFSQVNHLPLTYRATLINSTELPHWLRLNRVSGAVSGTPFAHDVGLMHIVAVAEDRLGAVSSTKFDLRVVYGPEVNLPIPNQVAFFSKPFSFTFSQNTFVDRDKYPLDYRATSRGGKWPPWLSFDSATRTFSGEPEMVDGGSIHISVDAVDLLNLTASTSFMMDVVPELPPVVLNPLPDLRVQVGENVHFVVPETIFGDPYGRDVTYAYSATLSDNQLLPSWLSFDPMTRTFSGVPGSGDTDLYSTATFEVSLKATEMAMSKVTTFSISVSGTSYGAMVAKVMGPIVAAITTLYKMYKWRGKYWNRCRKRDYQKPPQRAIIGHPYSYLIETPRAEISCVEALFERRETTGPNPLTQVA